MAGVTKERVLEVLKNVIDPEIGINIVDLGFIYGVDIKGKKIHVNMTLTTPGCPMHSMFVHEVENALKAAFDGVDVEVEMVFDPPWTPERMSKDAKKKLGIK
jgi:metal-sulfur cluster biosynthetic enzyme